MITGICNCSLEVTDNENFFLRCLNFENARRSLFIDISDINSSFKNLPSHLKVKLLLFGDSKLFAIDNNLILKASIKYMVTTNRFSVPLFWYCFLSLALNIYIHFFPSCVYPLATLFSLFYLRKQWDMCLCCIFLFLFWLSLCKIFFIYFLSCPIVINYIVKKNTGIKNFDGSKCNSDEWWNNKKCRCESKNVIYVKKIMFADLLHIIVKMKNI